MSCVICFESCEHFITCCNDTCNSSVCPGCFEEYINYSLTEKRIPTCTNVSCKSYYTYSNLKIYENIANIYVECVFNELLNIHGEEASNSIKLQNKVDSMRQEKLKLIEDRFSEAIKYLIINVLTKKFNSYIKTLQQTSNTINTFGKKCMNIFCEGYLDTNFICNTCNSQFCQQCEELMAKGHVCKQENVDSVNSIKSLVKCPKCHLPIFKSEGCDLMTCSNCSTNFTYSNGQFGGSGNHHNSQITIPKIYSLSNVYESYLHSVNCYDLMIELENIKKNIKVNTKPLLNNIKLYYKNKENYSPQDKIRLAKSFDIYIKTQCKNKLITKYFFDIETHIKNKTLTLRYLQRVYKELI